MLLADLGADVIKVEEVSRGDDTRSWLPPVAPTIPTAPKEASHLPPESAYFLAVNRNKRSITVNFKTPEGLEILHRLIKNSDVLVENFISGKLASMGLGYEDCKKLNPKLIYASITGYGQTGPFKSAAGYDVVIEGEAGLMHITGEPGGSPCKVGVAATDIATGLYAHGAIMAALISRQQTGRGVWIDCNLFETQIAGLANIASNYLIAGQEASRHGTAHPSIVPYQVFPCKDGFVMIGAGNNKQFKSFAEKVLEKPELVNDPKFSTNDARVANRTELVDIINEALMEHDREYWLERLTGLGVPFGPINNIQQTFEHPQVEVAEEPIDMEIFQQILELDEDDDDRDFSKGMVEAYFTQAEETFEKLDKALKQSDLATLSDLGHFLKGSSAALGVFRVQAECEKIQNLGKLAHHDEKKNEVKDVTEEVALEKIRESLVTVKGEYAAAEKWLRTYYNDPTDEDS
ncbi:hypothetical protein EST38_g1369 [Candolleomyces aberdarensis]|uniref:HPt domain-containing protein n=1 Tax=Candolleomyces aberdarensis TaxID=2316362 RepID=A0A4Q2DWA3_9AGAR|nr:hypothetical protein EST38_g1369 [Candolleomyces aberdarensis]